MKGTEKQVKWATEIRSNLVNAFETAIAAEPKMQDVIRPYIDRLSAEDVYAGDIIDLFRDVRFTGEFQRDLPNVMAVYHMAYANTVGQHAILGR